MGKPTLILVLLAALGLGTLIGVSLVDDEVDILESGDADSAATVTDTGGAPLFRYLAAGDVTVESDEFGQPLPTGSGENFISRDRGFKSETLTIKLAADESVEYKAIMSQGDALVFRWASDGGQLYYDFHAHDEAFGPEFFTRYDEGEGVERAGSIVAAYSGQHGWFWLNLEARPVTITLNVSGFYDDVIKIDLDGS